VYDRYVVCCTIDAAAWCMIIDGGVCGALPHFTSCFPLLTSLGTYRQRFAIHHDSPYQEGNQVGPRRKPLPSETVEPSIKSFPSTPTASSYWQGCRPAICRRVRDMETRTTDASLGRCVKWSAGWYRAYSMKPSRQPSSPPSSQAGVRERALQEEKVSQLTLAQPH
jgi:hypothetical protein